MTTTLGGHVKLADEHGAVLTGRAQAIDLRQVLVRELDAEGCLVLDFEGVETVSPSFADELFGRFVDQVGEDNVRFVNLNAHLTAVANMIRRRRGGAGV
jgi:hypothetical protein